MRSRFIFVYCLDENKQDYVNIDDYICYTGVNLSLLSIRFQSSTYKKMYKEISKIKLYKHLTDKQKEVIFKLINLNQKIKFILYKFIFRIKTKILKKKTSWNSKTISLSDISNISEKNLLKLYYNGKYFTFDATELAKSINTNLLTNEYMFPNPRKPKNPWNNTDFNIASLSAIYGHLISNNIYIPTCFMMFKKCTFNITKFKNIFFNFLSENAIKDYIFNLDSNTLLDNAIMEITNIAQYNGWIHKLPPAFPRFDTFCKDCFIRWIYSDDANIDLVKGSLFKSTCNSNIKHIRYKSNIIDELGITSKESAYYNFWINNHDKHMFHSNKKKKEKEIEPANSTESINEIVSEWITVGEQNFNRGQEESQPLTAEQMLIDLEEHDL